MRRLLLLLAGCAAFWVLTALPARHLGGGDLALVYSATALALCLVPGILTILWASFALRGDGHEQLTMVLGATGLRLFGVALAGYVLFMQVPLFREQDGFLVWLVVCYVFTLGLEMTLLLANRPKPGGAA